MLNHIGGLQRRHEQLAHGGRGRKLDEPIDQMDEGLHLRSGRRRKPPRRHELAGGPDEGDPTLGRSPLDDLDGPGTDPPGRDVDDAPEAHRVLGVDRHPEIAHQVLDLLAVVEAKTPDDLVRDGVAGQSLLQHAALGVGPVKDGRATPRRALLAKSPDGGRHELRLLPLVVGPEDYQGLAALPARKKGLWATALIERHDGRGGIENGLGRAVVLLEDHDPGIGVVGLEVEDVFDVGAPPVVDRLIIVSYDTEVVVAGGQKTEQPVLGVVRVLVLVHQEGAEALLVAP